MLALEGAEELKRSAPPDALAVGTSFIGLRRRNAQETRKLAFVLVLHLHGSDYRRTHNRTTRTQIADLYAAVMHGTQVSFDLAEQLKIDPGCIPAAERESGATPETAGAQKSAIECRT